VRLAIFSEHRRLPLRRDEINKKGPCRRLLTRCISLILVEAVVGSGTRAFNAVFQAAQATLRDTFGMELAELHKHSEGDDTEEAQATGVKKRGKFQVSLEQLDPHFLSPLSCYFGNEDIYPPINIAPRHH
jgi:hypothetical protein